MNLSSRTEVRAYLNEHDLAPKKRFGQNFLLDRHYRDRIVEAVGAGADDEVWEIGPGLGALTEGLLASGAHLVLFEVDWGLVRHLERTFSPPAQVIPGDFRKTWKRVEDARGAPSAIVGNLPYRLAATIIGDILEAAVDCRTMVFTVQKEVAERMVAEPGTANYSSFSVLSQSGAAVRRLFDVPPRAFLPVPEVESSVVELTPGASVDSELMNMISRVVRICFSSRRKTLRRNLSAAPEPDLWADAFLAEGIDLSLRAERVSPAGFRAVAFRLLRGADC